MAEHNFPIPGSDKEKEIIIFVRRHWVAFLGQFILAFLMLVIPIVIAIIIYSLDLSLKITGLGINFLVLIASAYYLIAITFAFVSWVSFYYNVYIVTRGEIIEITQIGFFGRKISQLSLLRVQDVTSSMKGFLPTFFSFGDVLVETASEQKETFLLQSVPNPQEISARIMNLHDEAIAIEDRHSQVLNGEGNLTPKKNEVQSEIVKTEVNPDQLKDTPYQELLNKEIDGKQKSEGEVSHDDLDKGGEVDLK